MTPNEKARLRRQENIKAGLCAQCGDKLPEGYTYKTCEVCRAYNKAQSAIHRATRSEEQAKAEREKARERYAARKAAGICTLCGKAPAIPGKTLCEKCRLISRGYAKKANFMNPKRYNAEASKARYEARKAAGLCVACGRFPAADGLVNCRECAEKNRKSAKKSLKKRRTTLKQAGVCTNCGKAPAAEGHAYCENCIQKHRERNERCRQGKRAENND